MKTMSAFVTAMMLHAGLAALLLISFDIHFSPEATTQTAETLITEPESTTLVKAAVVDEEKVMAEIKRLEKIESDKQKKIAAQLAEAKAAQKAKDKAISREAQLKQEVAKLKAKNESLDKAKRQAEKKAKAQREKAEKLAKAEKEKAEKLAKAEKARAEKEAKEKAEKARLAKEAEAKEKARLAEIAEKKRQETERLAKIAEARAIKTALSSAITDIMQQVSNNWLRPLGSPENLACIIKVRVMPSGEVLSALVQKSSGDLAFDRAAEAAVRKASPLPMPEHPKAREKLQDFTFTFRPEAA